MKKGQGGCATLRYIDSFARGWLLSDFLSKQALSSIIQLYVFLERKARKRMVMKIKLPFNRCLVIASPKKRYEILPVETVNFYREKIDRCSAALRAIRQEVSEHGFCADWDEIVFQCDRALEYCEDMGDAK